MPPYCRNGLVPVTRITYYTDIGVERGRRGETSRGAISATRVFSATTRCRRSGRFGAMIRGVGLPRMWRPTRRECRGPIDARRFPSCAGRDQSRTRPTAIRVPVAAVLAAGLGVSAVAPGARAAFAATRRGGRRASPARPQHSPPCTARPTSRPPTSQARRTGQGRRQGEAAARRRTGEGQRRPRRQRPKTRAKPRPPPMRSPTPSRTLHADGGLRQGRPALGPQALRPGLRGPDRHAPSAPRTAAPS